LEAWVRVPTLSLIVIFHCTFNMLSNYYCKKSETDKVEQAIVKRLLKGGFPLSEICVTILLGGNPPLHFNLLLLRILL